MKRNKLATAGKDDATAAVSNDVDLAFFERGLLIDKDALDEAFIEQPDLLQKVSARYAVALSLRDEAKDRVKQIEAELYVQTREERTVDGARAPSENTLNAVVDSHPRRIKAVARYVEAVRESALWEGMFESYRARGFALAELNKLYLAGYFASGSAQAGAAEAGRRDYDDTKQRIRDARKARARE